MSWRETYNGRLMEAPRALRAVKRGQRVFVGTACAEPQALVRALMDKADELHDVEILHFVTLGKAEYTSRRFDRRFRHNAFFIGANTCEAVSQGRADYTPMFMYELQRLFQSGDLPLDVALIQVSPPGPHGFVSLGIGVDVVSAAAYSARFVIAQVNQNMPRTMGNTHLHVRQINAFVEHDEPLMEFEYPAADEVGQKIAQNAAKLIEDGDTLHMGYGHIPHAVLGHLANRRDLGIHAEVVNDSIIDLIEAGVITGSAKSHFPGRVVCSFCIGTRRMYDYVHLNPIFAFLPAQQVYNPIEIAKNQRMASLAGALEVDLTGQVSSESHAYRLSTGIGGRLDFLRGAAMSEGGKPIITIPSTTKDGQRSRIVHRLAEGAGVIATRADVHYVVTEYGIAYLHGRTVRERALALINIAHPRFRDELLAQAKQYAYVYPDQILLHAEQNLYPEEAEAEITIAKNTPAMVRPIKPTDEVLLQKYFYALSEETVFNRYFRPVRAMDHQTAQGLVNPDYDKDMTLVITTGPIGREKIVAMGRYCRDEEGGLAEVAITVCDEYQGKGLGGVLQRHLAAYARRKGVKGFWAYLFGTNQAMYKLFAQLGPYTQKEAEPGILRLEHRFARAGDQKA